MGKAQLYNTSTLRISKRKRENLAVVEVIVDETVLFQNISKIIENYKVRAGFYANREIVFMYWKVGIYINSTILDKERAEYGKNILSTLSTKLMKLYGKSFYVENIFRMMRFAKVYPDFKILSTASTKLS